MKKFVIPLFFLLIIIGTIYFSITLNTKKEITSSAEIQVIKEDSDLDLLINLGDFSKENYIESKLLDVAMQYANKLGLMSEIIYENNYIQYVSKDELHNLIFELTGLVIEAPIEIEDFYYLYDSENSYYYYLGSSPTYYSTQKINSMSKENNQIFINCTITKIEDGEIIDSKIANISLMYYPKKDKIKYSINSIHIE